MMNLTNLKFYLNSAMTESAKARDDAFGPISRGRSSSDTASSKPIPMLQRRQTHTGTKILNVSLSPTGGKSIFSNRFHLINYFLNLKKLKF